MDCSYIRRAVLIILLDLLCALPVMSKDLVQKNDGMEMRLFRPAVDTKGHITTDGTTVLPHLSFSLGMMLDFSFNHWIAVEQSGDFYGETMIEKSINGVFMANLGLVNMLVVGIQLPMGVASGVAYDGVDEQGNSTNDDWSTRGSFGDVALHVKASWLRADRYPVGLGTIVQYQFGSGTSELLLGEPGKSGAISGKLIVDSNPARWYRVALNVGARYAISAQKENRLNDVFIDGSGDVLFRYGPILNAGLGQSFSLWTNVLDFVVEVYGNQLASKFGNSSYMSVEAGGGFKLYVDGNSYLTFGGGGGLPISDTDSGYGFQGAQWRLFLGFMFEPSIGDRDGDGIPDDADQCPDEPEDRDDFEDSDGCPDPDNDRDGILDVDDSCPLVKEDRDGNEDSDGCPEQEQEQVQKLKDRDGDGIIDEEDECPDDPEDRDGFEDSDGCPDLDNDRDGFPDLKDECPLEREILNGFEDDDGCPDEGEELVTVTEDRFELLKGVRFKTSSHEIVGQQSFEILDAVTAVLKANPGLRVLVEGHTDSRGRYKYNMGLSKRRAKSVKTYLINNGIDASRLESEGYGPDRPIDTNETEEGRSVNRRVVFTKIKD
ncbi:MAG: OmpA family protein [Proteobacteria bacterium]|nr:OmpA family protein [Pseudomonadota bacterium]